MPNPIKAIKGGVQGVKNAVTTVKINNKIAKSENPVRAGKTLTKKTLGPVNIAKGFMSGAKNPTGAKTSAAHLKSVKAAVKKG
jgi:hypothetical protein